LNGCAAPAVSSESFSFAIIGDAPYKPREEAPFERMMERIDREDVAFTIHVGDIGAGRSTCTDAGYEKRFRQLDRSRHPLIYTPGDNEWVDCRGMGFDVLETRTVEPKPGWRFRSHLLYADAEQLLRGEPASATVAAMASAIAFAGLPVAA